MITIPSYDRNLFLAAPGDFTGINRTLEFDQNTPNVSVTISIIEDRLIEGTENFQASLSLITNRANIIVRPNETTISIEDSAGKLTRQETVLIESTIIVCYICCH